MCSVYAISKVVEREIKFKAIVAAYRSIYPSVSQQVMRPESSLVELDSLKGNVM